MKPIFFAILSLAVCAPAMAATKTDPAAAKIEASLPAVLDANATFCLVIANYGATDTVGWISVSCNGKNIEADEPSTDDVVMNGLTSVNAAVLAKGMKLVTCSFSNSFEPDHAVYNEEHCYFTK